MLAANNRLISMLRKNLLCCKHSVQRRRESRIHTHLQDRLDNLLARQAHIQSGSDVHLELRRRIAERSQRSDGRQFPLLQAQARPRVDIPEAELDDVATKVGADISKRLHHALTRRAVDFLQPLPSFFESRVFHLRVPFRSVHLPSSNTRRSFLADTPAFRSRF